MRDQCNKHILYYLALDVPSRIRLLSEQRHQLALLRAVLEEQRFELLDRQAELQETIQRLRHQQEKSLQNAPSTRSWQASHTHTTSTENYPARRNCSRW